MFLLGCSCFTATANKEHSPNLGPSYSYLDVAELLFTESKVHCPNLGPSCSYLDIAASSCADCLEICESLPPGTLRACLGTALPTFYILTTMQRKLFYRK